MSEFLNLGDALSPRAAPGDPALIDLGGAEPRRYSYADLRRLTGAVARGLRRAGLSRGDHVAIASRNRFEFLAVVMGAMRAGMVAVPINIKLPRSGVEALLEDCGARLAFCDSIHRHLVEGSVPLCQFDAHGSGGFDAFLDPGEYETTEVAGEQPAMMLYTSGSSGRPKGVILSHASHLSLLNRRRAALESVPRKEPERILVAAPLYHMNGLACCQGAFSLGAVAVLLPEFTPRSYIAAIDEHRCTVLTAVPPMIAMIMREREALAAADLGSVKAVRVGSAPISTALVESIRTLFPNAVFQNTYGTTEAGPVHFSPHPRGLPTPGVSFGCAPVGFDLRLVDAQGRVGDEGVLQIRSSALMNGYHNRPAETAAVITQDGYYITGDVMRRDADGFYFFVGRADDMFVCGGENVFPGQVEKLLETHPDVAQACVIGVPDEIKGHKPVAFVVTQPGAGFDEQALKAHCLANAPAYQHPRRIWRLASFPLMGTNKIDRKALLQQALQSADQ